MASTAVVATSMLAGISLVPSLAAWGAVYLLGYVTGGILSPVRGDEESIAWGVLRLLAGLLLSTTAFFLCLRVGLPWFVGPITALGVALAMRRGGAFATPRFRLTPSWDACATGVAAIVAFAPVLVGAFRMAPGPFPPMFFNVDTPYFLTQVHALVQGDTFPPPSLSVLGGVRSYHFGIHGLAALLSRSSGMAPHHVLFLVVTPLLGAGLVAAAVALARQISPALPSLVSIPLLLVPVPTLWYPFSSEVAARLAETVSSGSLDPFLSSLRQDYQTWGAASNQAHNIAANVLVLAFLAATAAAPVRGWRLPVFLAGVAFLVKAPTGVSILSGFCLMQAYVAARGRRVRPLVPALAAVLLFAGVYAAFWVVPGSPDQSDLELRPFYQLALLSGQSRLDGFGIDTLWLLLPALIVLPVRSVARTGGSLSWLLFAAGSFLVVNTLQSSDIAGSSVGDDWIQIMIAVPLVLHAYVLSIVGDRWPRLGAGPRAAVLCLVALAAVPPLAAAAHYAKVLLLEPRYGHEFVDNRSIGAALSVIPVPGSIIVTNDLRYPADNFGRDNRQMQIPGLFGHQAFAANLAYESYRFSDALQARQELLRAAEWSASIEESAREYRWSHLLVRKDAAHPATIPLERLFENDEYAVFRFDYRPAASAPRK